MVQPRAESIVIGQFFGAVSPNSRQLLLLSQRRTLMDIQTRMILSSVRKGFLAVFPCQSKTAPTSKMKIIAPKEASLRVSSRSPRRSRKDAFSIPFTDSSEFILSLAWTGYRHHKAFSKKRFGLAGRGMYVDNREIMISIQLCSTSQSLLPSFKSHFQRIR